MSSEKRVRSGIPAAARDTYAEAIVGQGLGMRPGEILLIDCEIAHRDLAIAMAEAAYRRGCVRVDIDYIDRRLQRARITTAAEATGALAKWQQSRLRATLSGDAAIVRIVGDEEPGVLAAVDPGRLSADFAQRATSVKWFSRALVQDRVRWIIAAWPTPAWARSVYPELDEGRAVGQLMQDLLEFCRLGPADGPNAWIEHAEMLRARAKDMTERAFGHLRFRGPGTDLTVQLADDGVWLGGGGPDAITGRMMYPNFPTEEIFTSPVPGGTHGVFRCTTPLSFNGRVIEAIEGEFTRGRLVRISAKREVDQQVLETTLATDSGAGRLGEVALVDDASRIGRAGRIYGETLLDENAASHIAFGNGFGSTRSEGSRINRSVIHIDVMIGSAEVSVDGIDADGHSVPIIVDGQWQLPE